MTYKSKNARHLLEAALEYKGFYRVKLNKKLARRSERRFNKKALGQSKMED